MAEPEQEPQRVAEDDDGDAEMGREPVLADVEAIDETALHHVPADGALNAAKREQAEQPWQERLRDEAQKPEHDKGHEEDDADEAAKEAVGPLPPVDGLELIEAHAALLVLIFGNLLIGGERLLPVAIGERRHHADDRLPFGDREA